MERRDVLKTAGGIGVGTAMGGLGLLALTGGAAAQSSFVVNDPNTVETDDGEIEFVSHGGLLRFEWEGTDTEATYGQYETLSRVQRNDGSWTAWKSHGVGSGPLGDDPESADSNHNNDGEFDHGEENTSNTFGGGNDTNSGPGTDGFFQFKFGVTYGQKNYAIVYDDESDLDIDNGRPTPHAADNPWATSRFNSSDDGGQRATNMEIRVVCSVYDGDPADGGTKLAEDDAVDSLTATVKNRVANGTTSGEYDTHIGADES